MRSYTEGFKLSAVKLVAEGQSITDVAKTIGVPRTNVGRWVKIYDKEFSNFREQLITNELAEMRGLGKNREDLHRELGPIPKQVSNEVEKPLPPPSTTKKEYSLDTASLISWLSSDVGSWVLFIFVVVFSIYTIVLSLK